MVRSAGAWIGRDGITGRGAGGAAGITAAGCGSATGAGRSDWTFVESSGATGVDTAGATRACVCSLATDCGCALANGGKVAPTILPQGTEKSIAGLTRVRRIGDGLASSSSRCALPTIAFLETPRRRPISAVERPWLQNSVSRRMVSFEAVPTRYSMGWPVRWQRLILKCDQIPVDNLGLPLCSRSCPIDICFDSVRKTYASAGAKTAGGPIWVLYTRRPI
jgi:hypothetical protein